MRIKLLREASIKRQAGEIVEVSPAECAFLTSVGSAIKVDDKVKAEPVSEVEEPVEEKPTKIAKPVKRATRKK